MDPPQIKIIDNNSLMVINKKGIIRQLYVPIKVQVLYDTKILKKNSIVFVDEIQAHQQYKILYRITDNWWSYHLFSIAATF